MGKNDYINYNRRYSGRRRKKNSGPVIGILLVMLIAFAAGFTAYHLTQGNLPQGPGRGEYTGTSKAPTPTGTAVVEVSATPTPTETPTPTIEPNINELKDYLVDFVDNRTPVNAKAVYASKIYDQKYVDQIVKLAQSTELNAVVIDVRDDYGRITYNMNYPAAQEIGATTNIIKDMPALLKTLHDNGVYVIARVVCFREIFMNGEKSSVTQKAHPEWFCTSKKVNADSTIVHSPDKFYVSSENSGQSAVWMNPYNDDACKYIVGVAAQAIRDGFDEVCFDYIRCTTQYISTCDFGIPDEEYVPRTESSWGFPRTITDRITAFSRYACNVIKPMGGYISASVFGMTVTSPTDEECLGQNYKLLSQYFDYLCPMVYAYGYAKGFAGLSIPNNHPDQLVDYVMAKSAEKLAPMAAESVTGHVATVRPWLQASKGEWVDKTFEYTPEVIRSQFPGCYNNGVTGWMLWNSANYYVDSTFAKK